MAEQLTLPLESNPTDTQLEDSRANTTSGSQTEHERARESQEIQNAIGTLLTGHVAKIDEGLANSPSIDRQKNSEIEASWMIKEASEPTHDATTIQSQVEEAWTLHDAKETSDQLADEVAARKMAEQETEEYVQESLTDTLTRLPNREGFMIDAENIFGNNPGGCWVGFMDLDKFKALNDKSGHEAGNEVLKEIANILKEQIPNQEHGVVARLHGDEFAFALNNISSQEQAEQIINTLKSTVKHVSREGWTAGVSIGMANGSEARTVTELLKIADSRMYEDKEAERKRILDDN